MIRRLSVQDAAAFRAVRLNKLVAHPESFSEQHDDVAARPVAACATLLANAHIFAAEQAGRIIGTCGWYLNALDSPEITWLYLDPDRRGTGIAQDLMQATIASVPVNYGEVMLQTAAHNAAALRVCDQMGFVPARERRDFLASGCDRVMIRPLHA